MKQLIISLFLVASLNAATVNYVTPGQATNIASVIVASTVTSNYIYGKGFMPNGNATITNASLTFKSTNTVLPAINFYNYANSIYPGFFNYYKSRGDLDAPTGIEIGDILGGINFGGYHQSAYRAGVSLYTVISQTNSATVSLGTDFVIANANTNGTFSYTTNLYNGDWLFPSNIYTLDGNSFVTRYGNSSPSFVGRRARGTLVTPLVVLSNDYLITFGARPHDGVAFTTASKAYISAKARENWGVGTNGTYWVVATTATNSTTTTEYFVFDHNGYMGIGVGYPTNMLDVNGMISSRTNGFMFPNGSVQTNAADGITTNITLYTHADDGTTPITNSIVISNGTIRAWTY